MGFKFPLATVLRVRESIEKREEQALQRVQLEIARVQRLVDEVEALISRSHKAREEALRQPMAAISLQTMLWEQQAVEARKTMLLGNLRVLGEQREKQMKIYQAAHRDHESIVSMFHEQRAIYEQEQLRIQQKYLDDIFVARRQRSRNI